jgi:hypothetical protein
MFRKSNPLAFASVSAFRAASSASSPVQVMRSPQGKAGGLHDCLCTPFQKRVPVFAFFARVGGDAACAIDLFYGAGRDQPYCARISVLQRQSQKRRTRASAASQATAT